MSKDPQDSNGNQAEEFIYSKSDNEVLLRKKPAGRENVRINEWIDQ